jgi:hypothetical protein
MDGVSHNPVMFRRVRQVCSKVYIHVALATGSAVGGINLGNAMTLSTMETRRTESVYEGGGMLLGLAAVSVGKGLVYGSTWLLLAGDIYVKRRKGWNWGSPLVRDPCAGRTVLHPICVPGWRHHHMLVQEYGRKQ